MGAVEIPWSPSDEAVVRKQKIVDNGAVKNSGKAKKVISPKSQQGGTTLRSSESLEKRRQALQAAARPLPGSVPAENRRPLRIPGRLDGFTLSEALGALFPQVSNLDWAHVIAAGELLDTNSSPANLTRVVRAGEEFTRITPDCIEPEVAFDIEVLYEDEILLVVSKPAPLPVHPCGRFQRNTLQYLLRSVWNVEPPRPCHRLDADTSGVMVYALSRWAAHEIQRQFSQGSVRKRYLTKVHGHPVEDDTTVDLPIRKSREISGVREVAKVGEGQPCRTHIRVLKRNPDSTALLEVEPMTGRTNQIRLHLWHLGHPVVGDPSYLPNGRVEAKRTLAPGDAPMHLHCREVSCIHPLSEQEITFRQDPVWLLP